MSNQEKREQIEARIRELQGQIQTASHEETEFLHNEMDQLLDILRETRGTNERTTTG